MSEHELPDHDPQLSGLYRRTSGEQPAAELDEQILAQARQQAARRRQRRWLPLATAAVVVLAMGLLLRHQQRPDELMPQVALDVAQEAAPTVAAPMVAERAPASPEATSPVQDENVAREERAERSQAAPHDEQRAKAKAEVAAGGLLTESMAEGEAPASAPRPAATLEVVPAARRAATPSAPALAGRADRTLADEAPQAAATGVMAEPPQEAAASAEPPEAWLKRIEALRAKGQIEAARRELVLFRKSYPQWPVPQELQPLLPEAIK